MFDLLKNGSLGIALLITLSLHPSTPAFLFARKLAHDYRAYKANQRNKVAQLPRRPSEIAQQETVPYRSLDYIPNSEANMMRASGFDFSTLIGLFSSCMKGFEKQLKTFLYDDKGKAQANDDEIDVASLACEKEYDSGDMSPQSNEQSTHNLLEDFIRAWAEKTEIKLPSYIEPSTSSMSAEYARQNLEIFCKRAAQALQLNYNEEEIEQKSFDTLMRDFCAAQGLTNGKPINS